MTVDSLLTLGCTTPARSSGPARTKAPLSRGQGRRSCQLRTANLSIVKVVKNKKKIITFLKLTDDYPVLDPSLPFLLVLVDDSCDTVLGGVEGVEDGQEKAHHVVTEQQHQGIQSVLEKDVSRYPCLNRISIIKF